MELLCEDEVSEGPGGPERVGVCSADQRMSQSPHHLRPFRESFHLPSDGNEFKRVRPSLTGGVAFLLHAA